MLRPNLAQDKPPTALSVGGFSVPINTDFRVWLQVMEIMKNINCKPKSESAAQKTLENIGKLEMLVFGKILAEELTGEALEKVSEFLKGYPNAPMKESAEHEQTVSLTYDLNFIILAIRNQSGIDLSYRCKYFHWWEFLLEYQSLCGDHYILNLANIRGYKGKDPEMRRQKAACALPEEMTDEEKEEYEAFSALFD